MDFQSAPQNATVIPTPRASGAEESLFVPLRTWCGWAAILVLLYLILASIGWRRSFIETEAWALYFAGQPFSEHLAAIRNDLVHPPLMYLVHRGWFALFGQTDTAARFLPVVIATPAIFLLTLLSTRITSHWRLLSFFLACHYLPIGSSASQVRMYGLALLLTTAAILLWDAWRTSPRARTLVAWTVVTTLLIYTHLFGALIVAAFVVLNWLVGPRRWTFTLAAFVPALAFLPWFLYVLPVYGSRGLGANLTWVHDSLLVAIPSLFANFLGAWATPDRRLRLAIIVVAGVIHLSLLILFWRNRARFWPPRLRDDASRRWFWSSMVLAGVPISVLFAFSLVVNRAFEARFILGAAIPYSIAIFLLCRLSGRLGLILLFCILIPWRVGVIVNSVVSFWTPSEARLGAEFVARQVRPDDLILVDQPDYSSLVYWEWNRRLHRTEPLAALPPSDPSDTSLLSVVPPRPIEQLDLARVSRIWVFQSGPAPRPGLTDALASRGYFPASSAPSAPSSGRTSRPGSTAISKLFLFEKRAADNWGPTTEN